MAWRNAGRWGLIGMLTALAVSGGCQKEKSSPTAPDLGIRVARIWAERTALAPDDTTTVCALVLEGPDPGTPAEGVAVEFSSVSGEQHGTFSKAECVTGAQGGASTLFQSADTDSATVTLKASVGSSAKYLVLSVTPIPIQGSFMTFSTPD